MTDENYCPVPTHDACVIDTVEKIGDTRRCVVALLDGDGAGNDYVKMLLKTARPPEHVVQWADGFTVEDVVGWILGKEESLVPVIQAETPTAPATIGDIVTWIKTPTNQKGAKADFLAYEAIASAVLTSSSAKSRVRSLLEALVELTSGTISSKLLFADRARSSAATSVWRIVLEP